MARSRKQPGTGCVIERPSKQHGRVYAIRWRVNNGPARSELVRAGEDAKAIRRTLGRARRERGLSNVSVNKTLTLLRQVLAAAVRYGYIDRNPVEHVRRLKVTRRVKPFLQLDQVAPLVE